ncbi:MAG: HEPN domain-containing protein [Opitutales bacterium]|nr:HEPN domain-containing protein [Opitutales bacterium]
MDESKQWLAFAQEDLLYGKMGINSFPRAASWSFQQAVEKSLKSLLLVIDGEVPRTHDVTYILSLLRKHYKISEDIVEAVLLIAEITPSVRYPADDLPEITAQLAKDYYQAAEKVVKWGLMLLLPDR